MTIRDGITVVVHDLRGDAREGHHGGTRLGRRHARQRGDHDPASLGLPPGIDDRATAATDVLAIPHPRLWIDRLADRAEKAEAAQIVASRKLRSPLHEGPDGRRSGVEDGDFVILDDAPPSVLSACVGRPFVHHLRHAVSERSVDDVAVAGDPADVRRGPADVGFWLDVEDQAMGGRRVRQVPTGGVKDPLGFGRRARGVHDVERMLGGKGLRFMGRCRRVDHVVPPQVATFDPADLLTRSADHQAGGHRRAEREGCVDLDLESRSDAAAEAPVRCNDHLRIGIGDAVSEGLGGEAPEDHRVWRSDPSARQHGHDGLGDHRHVDHHPVARLHAK